MYKIYHKTIISNCAKELKGVKAMELMSCHPVIEIIVDEQPIGKIHFKSLAGITKTFSVEAFATGK